MRVLVLHSGGLDSTTLLHGAVHAGHDVISLGVDYGQVAQIELEYGTRQSDKLGVPRKIISVGWTKPDRQIPVNRHVNELNRDIPSSFLPARNIVFLSLAVAEGSGLGVDEVQIGINSIDFSGYPDCTPIFLESFCKMLEIGSPNSPRIAAPLIGKSKREIALSASAMGLKKGDTWSCYRPIQNAGNAERCGACDACRLDDYAWSVSL